MAIGLSPDSMEYIRVAVAQGHYQSEQQAMDEAVSLLKRRDKMLADIRAGVEQADRGELIPGEQAFDELDEWIDATERNANSSGQ